MKYMKYRCSGREKRRKFEIQLLYLLRINCANFEIVWADYKYDLDNVYTVVKNLFYSYLLMRFHVLWA
ncbi:hypothetical protein BGI36_00940 [Snodgrassella communis]|nr:hypothetical protein BGI36_00940 [Snodgrassella communis]